MNDIQGTKEPATCVIMQNVKTLAAGQSIQQDKDGKPQTVPVITLLVTPEQAETLALASSQGHIQLGAVTCRTPCTSRPGAPGSASNRKSTKYRARPVTIAR